MTRSIIPWLKLALQYCTQQVINSRRVNLATTVPSVYGTVAELIYGERLPSWSRVRHFSSRARTVLAVSVGNIVRVSGLSSELLSRVVHPL